MIVNMYFGFPDFVEVKCAYPPREVCEKMNNNGYTIRECTKKMNEFGYILRSCYVCCNNWTNGDITYDIHVSYRNLGITCPVCEIFAVFTVSEKNPGKFVSRDIYHVAVNTKDSSFGISNELASSDVVPEWVKKEAKEFAEVYVEQMLLDKKDLRK